MEPDFVFSAGDATAQELYMRDQVAQANAKTRYEEMAAELPEEHKQEFLRELNTYMQAVKKDRNATWPKTDQASRAAGLKSWDEGDAHWSREAFDDDVDPDAMLYFRPGKAPADEYKPDNMSPHLRDLQSYMTARLREGRGDFLWCS